MTAEYAREWRERNKTRTPAKHNNSTYINYGCRCVECRQAHAAYMRRWRQRTRS